MDERQRALEVLTEMGRLDAASRDAFLATRCGADSELAEGLRALAALVERADEQALTELGQLADAAGRIGGARSEPAAGGADPADASGVVRAASRARSDATAGSADVTGAEPWLSDVLREAFDDRAPPLLPDDRPLAEGDTVGKYRLERQLGEGGMGQVFVARDEKLGRTVALKTIRGDLALSEEARDRFHREARILSHLEHPRICRLYDAFAVQGTDVLVLEHIEGRTLTDVLADGPLPLDRALEIAEQISEALVAAHATGIVHRDLKPANVMVRADGSVKVLDFGIARRVDDVTPDAVESPRARALAELDTDLALTEQGAILGTLLFMSPEQARGESVGAAADLFALGLLLVELVTGHAARPAVSSRADALRNAQAGTTVALDDLPRGVRALVQGLVAAAPGERPDALRVLTGLRDLRAAPGRRRRRMAVGVVLLAFLVFAVKYVVDLDEQKSAAEAARDVADARTAQAEGLIRSTIDDLHDKLSNLGRIDLLEDLAANAEAYFEAVSPEALTDEELDARARMLYQLGDIAYQCTDYDLSRAEQLFIESRDLAAELVARHPDHGQRIKSLAWAEYYVGLIPWDQGRLDEAEAAWLRYRDLADRLVALDPTNPEWLTEEADSRSNLAALLQRRGDTARARDEFAGLVTVWEQLAEHDPGDLDYYRQSLAEALSWLADAQRDTGDLAGARASREREVEVLDELLERADANPDWRLQRLLSMHHQGQLLRLTECDFGEAHRVHAAAAGLARELLDHDPRNARWRRELVVQSLSAASCVRRGGRPQAEKRERVETARACLDALLADDPHNADLLALHAWCLVSDADDLSESGQPGWAAKLDEAALVLERLAAEAPGLEDLLAQRAGLEATRAEALERAGLPGPDVAWRRVLELTEAASPGDPLRIWRHAGLVGLGRSDDAARLAAELGAAGLCIPR